MGRDKGMPVNEEYADKEKFMFTSRQLHKVVFDIFNRDEQEFSASEYTNVDLKMEQSTQKTV